MTTSTPFTGRIGRYRPDAEAGWAAPVRPPEGSPNIVIVVLDDVGFAQLRCFGSDIDTPVIDAIAARGLRCSNFHTTALCSPTRAALLTGRNHHAVGMGRITDLATGFPGYNAQIPSSAAMLPRLLVEHGWATAAVGKWHLTPDEEAHLGAPRRTWPLGRGFERFYGFFHGETNQYEPALVYDNHRIAPPKHWSEGYHLSEDLVDRAIEFTADLRHVEPHQPFLMWLAFGACHSPHQAPRDWIDRYAGRFDHGWDVERQRIIDRQRETGLLPDEIELSERPAWVPAWESLNRDERRLYSRYMECFAAMLSHADHQLGRYLEFLDRTGDLDNTIVMVLSDNGASSEGGPIGSINDIRPWNLADHNVDEALARIDEIGGPWLHNNYPWGWTITGNTPFRRWKREVHEGGVCDPLIVSWPRGLPARNEVRSQYLHAIDILPTLLDLVGVPAPAVVDGVTQQRMDGTSAASVLRDGEAAEVRTTQYSEMFGSRAIYHEGWKAVTHVSMFEGGPASDDDRWELFHVAVDRSECHDLAGVEPERLATLVELWWREAEANQVLPVDSQPFFEAITRPPITPPRGRYVYYPGTGPVEETCAVNVRCRNHSINADIVVPRGGAHGVIIQQGTGYGGYVLMLDVDGRLVYSHNFVALETTTVRSSAAISPGRHQVGIRYRHGRQSQGDVELIVDDAVVGVASIPRFTLTRWAITGDGLTIGRSLALPVTPEYRSPFTCTADLREIVIQVEGEPIIDVAAEADVSIRGQ